MKNKKKENYSWKLFPILKTFKLYFKCSFYKTLLFSIVSYPLPILLNLSKENIQKRKNKILLQEIKKYILNKYELKIDFVDGSFALGGLLEVFSRRLYDFFKVTKKDVVYDVGATIGEYGLKCAKNGADVLAFELEEVSYKAMTNNIKANKLENKIIPFHCKVDDKKNSLDFFFNKTKKAPTLMKIDIEGDEKKALQGAKKILNVYKPRLILETHSKELEKDCLDFLRIIGYKVIYQIDMKSKNRETKLSFLKIA